MINVAIYQTLGQFQLIVKKILFVSDRSYHISMVWSEDPAKRLAARSKIILDVFFDGIAIPFNTKQVGPFPVFKVKVRFATILHVGIMEKPGRNKLGPSRF